MANIRIHEKTGMELIRISAGLFLFGSADSDNMSNRDEKPQRAIDLQEYWIGHYPVTNAQFNRFVLATRYRTIAELEGSSAWSYRAWVEGADWRHPLGPDSSIEGKENHPVVQISWHDSIAFCDWAGLSLPTEEQWEKAARGIDGRIWPWGNEAPTTEHCNFKRNVGDTTPVGAYSPIGDSPYGCADMAGNVWEWTGSWLINGGTRILRGGSWVNQGHSIRTAGRSYDETPHSRSDDSSFRCAQILLSAY